MLKISGTDQTDLLHVQVTGKLERDDYDPLQAALARMAERHEKFALLWEMRDFEGWTVKAGWEDLQTDKRYNDRVRKTAMVGRKAWQEWMTKLSKPFAEGKLRFFEVHEMEAAKAWLADLSDES